MCFNLRTFRPLFSLTDLFNTDVSAKTIYERSLKAIFEKNENRECSHQKRQQVNNNGTVPPYGGK